MGVKRVFFETEEVITKRQKAWMELDMDYFQFYHSAFNLVASLSSNCAKDFLLWVMSKVDEENRFAYSKDLVESFNEALSKIESPKHYARVTVDKAIAELLEKNIIMRHSRGEYTVNPKFFWNQDTKSRVKKIAFLEKEERMTPEQRNRLFPVFSPEELSSLPPGTIETSSSSHIHSGDNGHSTNESIN